MYKSAEILINIKPNSNNNLYESWYATGIILHAKIKKREE